MAQGYQQGQKERVHGFQFRPLVVCQTGEDIPEKVSDHGIMFRYMFFQNLRASICGMEAVKVWSASNRQATMILSRSAVEHGTLGVFKKRGYV